MIAPLVAISLALAAWIDPGGGLGAREHRTSAAQPRPGDTYADAAAHGAPIAVLARATALRAGPSASSRRLAWLRRRTEWGSPRVLAAVGHQGQWLRVIAAEVPNGHRGWIRASAASLSANPWAIRVDLSQRRVTVLRRGRVVRSFRVAVGGPGTSTPTGNFAVTDKLELAGGSASYACCALALSGHQPHVAQGWTGGDRLAIHGTHNLASIGRAASLGCMRARDRDAYWLVRRVFLGTIVTIRR